jgi:hypothetical protein
LPIDTRIDPDDSDAMLEALREFAKAVESFESRLMILEADVSDLRSDVRDIEDQANAK